MIHQFRAKRVHLKKGLQVHDGVVRHWLWLRGPQEVERITQGVCCLEAEDGGLVLDRPGEKNWMDTALL